MTANLLTKYILASMWTRLLIFLAFYFIARGLHFTDIAFSTANCMSGIGQDNMPNETKTPEFPRVYGELITEPSRTSTREPGMRFGSREQVTQSLNSNATNQRILLTAEDCRRLSLWNTEELKNKNFIIEAQRKTIEELQNKVKRITAENEMFQKRAYRIEQTLQERRIELDNEFFEKEIQLEHFRTIIEEKRMVREMQFKMQEDGWKAVLEERALRITQLQSELEIKNKQIKELEEFCKS